MGQIQQERSSVRDGVKECVRLVPFQQARRRRLKGRAQKAVLYLIELVLNDTVAEERARRRGRHWA